MSDDGMLMSEWTNATFDANDTNEAREEAIDRLIELHQEEFDLLFDACQIAEELKHRPKPKRHTTTTSTSYNTTTSTTTTTTGPTWQLSSSTKPGRWQAKGRPLQPKSTPRPQPLTAIQRIVARFRR